MENKEIKVRKQCVMNTTDTSLVLDENGVLDRTYDYEERIPHGGIMVSVRPKWWIR